MAARGRPTKILTPNDLQALQQFLQQLPFLKKNQQQALTLLRHSQGPFTPQQLTLLKTVDREKNQFQTRQALIQQIQLKHKNQQPLTITEKEILGLLNLDMDQDNFFRLDRALESYQKIEKATLADRIRVEKEDRKELLRKTNKELTEAQKKRNAENQLKYALGGMLQSLYKELGFNITQAEIPLLEHALIQSLMWEKVTKNTKLYKAVEQQSTDINEARDLFHRILEDLPTYKIKEQEFHTVLIQKHRKTP